MAVIHLLFRNQIGELIKTICGKRARLNIGTFDKRQVTCKHCLKMWGK